jgi:dTDP-4-amino-4,6-dideoxygalactose transaminase
MDPVLLEAAITEKTKAIIPVHLYGQTVDMDPVMEIAKKHDLLVIEDACQAHGAKYKGKRAGSIGDAGCFSFYPGKNLGAYGEAGAVVTNNDDLANKIKMFRDHGQNKKYYHSIVGWNGRMDGFQGAVLSVKLKHLEDWNQMRINNAAYYSQLLQDVAGITTPSKADYARHVYHIYAMLTDRRDEMLKALADKQIYCGIHYPVPLHIQEAYKNLGYKQGDFPVAEKVASTQISLPMFAELNAEQIEEVVKEIQILLDK